MANADGNAAVFDDAGTRAAFVRNGDIFLRNLADGRLTQVTRTAEAESAPQFSADGRKLSFRRGHDWLIHDMASGVTAPAAIVKADKDPATEKPDALGAQQLRYFSTLREIKNDKNAQHEHAETMQRDDPTRAPLPFWLGDDVQIVETTLAPDAHWLIAVTAPKNADEGKKGKLTRFVTESGYEEFEDERTRVGLNDPALQTLWLFDLVKHTSA